MRRILRKLTARVGDIERAAGDKVDDDDTPETLTVEQARQIAELQKGPPPEVVALADSIRFVPDLPESSDSRRRRDERKFVAALQLRPNEWAKKPPNFSIGDLIDMGCAYEHVDGTYFVRWQTSIGTTG